MGNIIYICIYMNININSNSINVDIGTFQHDESVKTLSSSRSLFTENYEFIVHVRVEKKKLKKKL